MSAQEKASLPKRHDTAWLLSDAEKVRYLEAGSQQTNQPINPSGIDELTCSLNSASSASESG